MPTCPFAKHEVNCNSDCELYDKHNNHCVFVNISSFLGDVHRALMLTYEKYVKDEDMCDKSSNS